MDEDATGQITRLLSCAAEGDLVARDRLWEVVYPEVKRKAQSALRDWSLRGVVSGSDIAQSVFRVLDSPEFYANAKGRRYFFGAVGKAVTRLLTDEFRGRAAMKRGGAAVRLSLSAIDEPSVEADVFDAIAFEETVERLETFDRDLYETFVFRCLLQQSASEIAELQGIDESTVRRRWRAARAWLMRELSRGPASN